MEERLRKFAFLVDAGSFTKAARELHLSQPALSASIAKLERELHAEVLVHGSRPLQLTAAGRLAYRTAQELAARTQNLAEQLASLERKQRSLAIGMIDSVASALFASGEAFDELEREADVSVVVNNSRFLLEAVAAGELDVALIVTHGRRVPDGLAAYFVATEPLVLVCHTDVAMQMHIALRRGKLPRFIAYDRPSTTNQLVAEALRENGITAQTTFYSTSPEVMLRLVLLQKGAAVLPYLLAREFIAEGKLTLLGNTEPLIVERRISSVTKRNNPHSPALMSVLETVGSTLAHLDTEVRGKHRTN